MTEGVSISTGDSGDVLIDASKRQLTIVERLTPSRITIITGGSGGSSAAMHWSPPSALSSWMIPHNLGYKPVVQIIDSTGSLIFTKVTHVDINTCLIEFSQPVSGIAELR